MGFDEFGNEVNPRCPRCRSVDLERSDFEPGSRPHVMAQRWKAALEARFGGTAKTDVVMEDLCAETAGRWK